MDFRDRLVVRVGDVCTLQGRFTGKPAPTITWTKNEEELKADEEVIMTNTSKTLCLAMPKAKREHSGRYQVVVENIVGLRKGICSLTVVGKLVRVFFVLS